MAGNNTFYPVQMKTATLGYATQGVATKLFSLPPLARILFFLVDVQTPFNDTGTDYLQIGTQTVDNYYAANVDLSAADQIMVQQTHLGNVGSNVKEIWATYNGQNADGTQGLAEIMVVFAMPFQP
jgi:hypothetical protein